MATIHFYKHILLYCSAINSFFNILAWLTRQCTLHFMKTLSANHTDQIENHKYVIFITTECNIFTEIFMKNACNAAQIILMLMNCLRIKQEGFTWKARLKQRLMLSFNSQWKSFDTAFFYKFERDSLLPTISKNNAKKAFILRLISSHSK